MSGLARQQSLWSAGQEGIKYYIAVGRPKAETSFLFLLGEAQAGGTASLLAVNFQLARDIAKMSPVQEISGTWILLAFLFLILLKNSLKF